MPYKSEVVCFQRYVCLSNSSRNSVTLASLSKNYLAFYSYWIHFQARRIFFRLIFFWYKHFLVAKITRQCGATSQKEYDAKGVYSLMLLFLEMMWRNATARLQDYVTELQICQCDVIWWGSIKEDSFWPYSTLWVKKNNTLAITIAINVVCIGWLLENRYLVAGLKFDWGSLLRGWTKFRLMEGIPTGDSPLPPFRPVGKTLTNMGKHKKYKAELSEENLAM